MTMTPNMRLFIVLIAMMLGIHYCLTITSGKIAETFEIPMGTVMSRLSRARKNLAECIDQ